MRKIVRIGPYQPALLEPEFYALTVEDRKIVGAEIKLGYAHRGIEKLMTTKTYRQNVFLCERICGICSHAHTSCYCQTVEGLFDLVPPDRARYIRTLIAELERLHSHYLWFAVLSHTLRQTEYFLKILEVREQIMDLFELVCGNRVHYAMNTIGGVRRDLNSSAIGGIKKILDNLGVLSNRIFRALGEGGDFTPKISGLGVLSKEKASELGAVGPVLRASGVKCDIRKDDPYAAYGEVDFEVPVEKDGDIHARALVRARETQESISIIQQVLDNLPAGDLSLEAGEPPEKEEVGRVEAPRGELLYYVKSDGTHIPERVKMRPPTFVNVPPLTEMLMNQELGNAQLIIESVDQCISCADRVTIIDRRTGRKQLARLSDLR